MWANSRHCPGMIYDMISIGAIHLTLGNERKIMRTFDRNDCLCHEYPQRGGRWPRQLLSTTKDPLRWHMSSTDWDPTAPMPYCLFRATSVYGSVMRSDYVAVHPVLHSLRPQIFPFLVSLTPTPNELPMQAPIGFFLVEMRGAGPCRGGAHTLHGCVRRSPI